MILWIKYSLISFILVFWFISGQACIAQDISGRLIDQETGEPIVGEKVTACEGDQPMATTWSGSDGYFEFNPTGTGPEPPDDKIKIYSSHGLNIETPFDTQLQSVDVLDINGRYVKGVAGRDNKAKINTSDLANGTYPYTHAHKQRKLCRKNNYSR